MNWSDERYVRLYTRDTATWIRWRWETRAVLCLLLRKVDRSGVLDTGRSDKVGALSLMLGVPVDVASVAVSELLGVGTMVESEAGYVLPAFLDAQEAAQSDKVRQRESREKRRAASMRNSDGACHTPSQHVTDGHAVSQPVTPAVPSRAVPSQESMSSTLDLEGRLTDDEFQVFEHWRITLGHQKAKPTSERKRLIAKWLKVYSVKELQAAIDGCARSPFHMGENDRNKRFDDLALILRDAKHIEDFQRTA